MVKRQEKWMEMGIKWEKIGKKLKKQQKCGKKQQEVTIKNKFEVVKMVKKQQNGQKVEKTARSHNEK